MAYCKTKPSHWLQWFLQWGPWSICKIYLVYVIAVVFYVMMWCWYPTESCEYSGVQNSRTEIDEHLEEIAENLTVEHLFFIISIATNNRTPEIFSTALIMLIVKWVWLLGTPEYVIRKKNTPVSLIEKHIWLFMLWEKNSICAFIYCNRYTCCVK